MFLTKAFLNDLYTYARIMMITN